MCDFICMLFYIYVNFILNIINNYKLLRILFLKDVIVVFMVLIVKRNVGIVMKLISVFIKMGYV